MAKKHKKHPGQHGKHANKRNDQGVPLPITYLVPSIAPVAAKFRGPSSSSDENSFTRAAYNDLINAYSVLAAQNANLNLQNEVLVTNLAVAQMTISSLNNAVSGLQQNYASLLSLGQGGGNQAVLVQSLFNAPVSWGGFPSYFPPGAPMSAQTRAQYDAIYGQILPNEATAPVSKAYLVDLLTQNIVTPPDVIRVAHYTITPTQDIVNFEESDPGLAVDGDSTTFWRRNYYFPANQVVNTVEQTIHLKVPQQFINNLLCNYVTIHPYPEFGVDISSVEVHTTPDKGNANPVQLLPLDSSGNVIPIASAGKTRIIFPDTKITSVTIKLRQNNANLLINPGLQTYTLGASILDFGYITFTQNSTPSLILIPFTLQNNFFNVVGAISPAVQGVNYNLYYQDPTGDIVLWSLGQPLPAFINRVYVECDLTLSQGVLPVISSLQIQYIPTLISG